jgi:hypothetical protein
VRSVIGCRVQTDQGYDDGAWQGSGIDREELATSALDSSAATPSGHSTGARSYVTLYEVLYSPSCHGPPIQIPLELELALAAEVALESGRAADKSGPLGTIDSAAT